MSRRTGLREFQLSVVERLRTAASTRSALASRLGFQVGSENWFVPLHLVSEVIPVPPMVSVPLTHSWFRGVSNVRGNLYGIVDLSAFQGGEPTGPGVDRRVILVNERLIGGSGLLVSRMLGLRNPEQFTPTEKPAGAPPWAAAAFTDAGGNRWMELDLPLLVKEQRFIEVGA